MPRTDPAAPNGAETSRATLEREHASLLHWLVADAYPLWATWGFNEATGAFAESLTSAGPIAGQPHRARVLTRQIYSYARAADLGWSRHEASRLVSAGIEYLLAHYRRSDGLFRTLVADDGTTIDDRAFLYEQAFVLLALAESQTLLGRQPELLQAAQLLRAALYQRMKRAGAGFSSGVPEALPLQSNPHMHLFESALSWNRFDGDPAWQALADEIVGLALSRFIDPGTGALREHFDANWSPLAGTPGRIVEPGHQFEWAWLLLCWGRATEGDAYRAAQRLVQIGEAHGVRDGIAINALLDDFSVHDGEARLWPQTERLKAAVRMAAMTGEPRFWSMAAQAAAGLRRYLDTEVRGLWHDRLTVDGRFLQQPAPASSFYHIVCAIDEVTATLKAN
jgi:mannose/cellobiose epimerase-like protein (N-acyl-D-glucosamine 2-epimerase family)